MIEVSHCSVGEDIHLYGVNVCAWDGSRKSFAGHIGPKMGSSDGMGPRFLPEICEILEKCCGDIQISDASRLDVLRIFR